LIVVLTADDNGAVAVAQDAVLGVPGDHAASGQYFTAAP
jgi:hypothetical protein